MEKVMFDWPIVLQYYVKAKYRLMWKHEVFSPKRSLNQPKATRVCIRLINQSNNSISVRLLFLLCSPVFISRSSENRSIGIFKNAVFPFSIMLPTHPPAFENGYYFIRIGPFYSKILHYIASSEINA